MRLAWWTGGAIAVLAGVAIGIHVVWGVSLGRLGIELSTAGLVLQGVALAVGVVVVNLVSHAKARGVLVVQGLACLAAYGSIAIAWFLLLLVWWVLLGKRPRWYHFVLALGLTAWFAVIDRSNALVFSLLFGMRLAIFLYDRWQNRHDEELLGDYLVYLLPAPLIIVVPYLAIIPLFDRFAPSLVFGITPEKLRLAGSHLLRAVLYGSAYALASQWEPIGIVGIYGSLLRAILELGALASIALALLVLHGAVERPAIDQPWRATRISELWRRFGLHLRDALMFLFYTPALLRMRRWNRYLRIVLAVGWTVLVGNTLLHVVLRYAYLDDGLARTWHAVLGNAVLAIALAVDLCHQEWRRDAPERASSVRAIAGWALTFTIAAVAASR